MHSWRRLCCPVDFSDASRSALQHAAYLASVLNGELTLVHVRPAPSISRDREQELASRLAAWARDAEWRANREVTSTVLTGHPGDEIVRLAREGRCDVLVLGTRRAHLGLGSLVEQVMRLTTCPVVGVCESVRLQHDDPFSIHRGRPCEANLRRATDRVRLDDEASRGHVPALP